MTADMKDIILQCVCCHKEITDLSAAGWRNGERRSFECPECGCRTKVEAEVWLRLSSDAEETWRELYRLAQWNACETWFDSDGALRVYGADDLGGRELAALWIAPERGYEEAAGLHVTVDGGPVCPYPSTPEWSRRRPPRPSGSASRPSDARSRGGDCGRSRRRTATSHRPTASTGAHGTHSGNQVNKRSPSGLPQAGRRPSGRAPRWFLRDA